MNNARQLCLQLVVTLNVPTSPLPLLLLLEPLLHIRLT
jgi:hypothetical protein